GDEVTDLALYETVAEPLSAAARERIAAADYVTFTSASTATFLAQAGGMPGAGAPSGAESSEAAPAGRAPRLVSIGPVTTAAMAELGATPAVEADEATIDGLIAALVADATA
ncbi:MAG: uroporphyrinogen-III synthase, partial [Patulibacter sp.]